MDGSYIASFHSTCITHKSQTFSTASLPDVSEIAKLFSLLTYIANDEALDSPVNEADLTDERNYL